MQFRLSILWAVIGILLIASGIVPVALAFMGVPVAEGWANPLGSLFRAVMVLGNTGIGISILLLLKRGRQEQDPVMRKTVGVSFVMKSLFFVAVGIVGGMALNWLFGHMPK